VKSTLLPFAAAATLLLPSLAAQSPPTRISLDGVWQLAPEPRDPKQPWPHQAAVPAAFEQVLGAAFDGVAWYRRLLPLTATAQGARVSVEFAAVATHATVYCNGKEVGQHLGGWTPFALDITDALQWKEPANNVIEVRVDEKVGHNTQGFLPIIQPHFGGIWQSVTLRMATGATLDPIQWFAFGKADGSLQCRLPIVPGPGPAATEVAVDVLDGATVIASGALPVVDGAARGTVLVASPRLWSPTAPHRYRVATRLRTAEGNELDRIERPIVFRSLQADGTTFRWNGAPLSVRGILHWGFSPPEFAPSTDARRWRRDLEYFRSLGFNTLKCCLFVPPAFVYDLCEELGLLVWQEYPTWHPQMDAAHHDELLREYREFFALDGRHGAVAFRSLTCETGHGAELPVVQALFDACHAAVPDTLVVDDSSWIGWQRVTDFWDEHPYGNHRWWPGRLAEFQQHIVDKGKKPLLLGECIASDTWADLPAPTTADDRIAPWWQPLCAADQRRFEAWILEQFGADTLASLGPIAHDYALRARRYQIERLRLSIPDAGYVVSVARDFPKARMGLLDDRGNPKWSAADWQWHGDHMLCLDTEHDARAFVVAETGQPIHARVARGGNAPSGQHRVATLAPVAQPTPVTVRGDVDGLRSSWDLWALPTFRDERPANVRVIEHLDEATLALLEQGERVYLHVHGQKLAPTSESKWYLTGAPFAPPHPVHRQLPARMLIELQPFDLDGGRVMPWAPLRDQVDPILAFWETHDLAEVKAHLFAFDCQVGKGRLLVSCFDRDTPAGRYVEHALLQHLATGPAPVRALSSATLASLRGILTEAKIDLPTWRFRTDPNNEGIAGNWQQPAAEDSAAPWRELRAGAHWENQAADLQHYTGVAWYRTTFEAGPGFANRISRIVFEGIDDSATVWLDGEQVAQFGDPATATTVWLQASICELGTKLAPGKHTLALRVVDHAGSGGLWKPVFLTTGPADAGSLLQR
jgi:hypothetical protein